MTAARTLSGDKWAYRSVTTTDACPSRSRTSASGTPIPTNQAAQVWRKKSKRLDFLRHAYAQNRYEELTGWKSPASGGPGYQALTPEQRKVDQEVRLTISREIGHERTAVTNAYLGK